jgi:hypothetical protein
VAIDKIYLILRPVVNKIILITLPQYDKIYLIAKDITDQTFLIEAWPNLLGTAGASTKETGQPKSNHLINLYSS